jgi:hypothetical protein
MVHSAKVGLVVHVVHAVLVVHSANPPWYNFTTKTHKIPKILIPETTECTTKKA